jgi:predicted aspartyl protease
MSTPYQTAYRPPFPALTILLTSDDGRLGPFPALLDSGADATLVPTQMLEEAGAVESGWVTLRSHFGHRQRVQRYLISIQINGILLPGQYVIGDDTGNEIILGRDVLNRLPLFLDGPQQQTDLLDDAIANRLRERRKRA